MFRIIAIAILTFSFLSFSRTAIGQNNGYYDKAMLWEISGPTLPGKSYLLGSIHVMCLHDFTLNEEIRHVLKLCSEAVFEMNTVRSDTSLYNRYPLNENSVEKLIGKKYFRKLSEVVNATRKYSIDSLNHTQPYVIASLLPNMLLDCKIISVDQGVLQLARKQNLLVSNLETAAQNAAPVNSMPLSTQVKILKERLDHLAELRASVLTDIQLYATGNLWQLYQRQFADDGRNEMRTAVLDIRSRHWVTEIQQKITEHPCVFVFGCSHLPGEGGVLNLLAKLGYTVRPVPLRR